MKLLMKLEFFSYLLKDIIYDIYFDYINDLYIISITIFNIIKIEDYILIIKYFKDLCQMQFLFRYNHIGHFLII